MTNHQDTEEKLAASLTAETAELLPYLAYLLQDIYELGSDPRLMTQLIRTHISEPEKCKALDLGCGKGAVSIEIAQQLGMKVHGSDLLPDFIKEARRTAEKCQVDHLCSFAVEDVNQTVQKERGYDVAILGAIGNVLGEPLEMLNKVKQVVKPQGYLLLDDGYLAGQSENVRYQNYEYLTLEQWNETFAEAGFNVLALTNAAEASDEQAVNDRNNQLIRQRAEELSSLEPQKRPLFFDYVKSQENESEDLVTDVVGATWLLQRK
ncbi:hypothetical protein NRIC_19620 [Enterococcus florum]|uniref:Methyltransferase domain-containing protein n=1 Tax=Enterococcus florum TaxID=2480627 RepID=A0A4P5PCQ3_9ENTE|nr:methyltransferase domain-containing protein [Enterococcus florum]GCF94071.1 hypothetical protein NRIC_19620 [Enterococcus florum]